MSVYTLQAGNDMRCLYPAQHRLLEPFPTIGDAQWRVAVY